MILGAELARRIRLGEDSTLEPKNVVLGGGRVTGPRRDDFADELAALANARGGTVVLGVDDKTRRVHGIPLEGLDVVERWAREVCNDSVTPPLDAHIHKVELEGVDGHPVPVIFLEIPRSLFVHRSPGGYFRRLGSSKREMAPEVLARHFQERSQSRMIRFDESLVPGTAPDDLDYALTRRFLREDSAGEGVTEDAARSESRSPAFCCVRANRSGGCHMRTSRRSAMPGSGRTPTTRPTPGISVGRSTNRWRRRCTSSAGT